MPPSHMIATTVEVVSVVVVDVTTVVVVVKAFSTNCLVVGVITGTIVDDIVVVDNGVEIVFSVEFVVEVTSDNVLACLGSGQYSLYGHSPISFVTHAASRPHLPLTIVELKSFFALQLLPHRYFIIVTSIHC